MASYAELVIRLTADTSRLGNLGTAGGKLDKLQAGVRKLTVPAGIAAAGITAFGKSAVDAASRTQQAMGAVDTVFGTSATQVKKWSDQAATSVGLSKSEYGELASVIGAQLKNLGTPLDQVAGKTDKLVGLGADLAATYGGTTADAVNALSSALKGETDPIERYGIGINQAAIAARQAADGTDKLTGKQGKAAKTAALLALVTEQSGGAVGQFARESGSAAGTAQIAAARFENMRSTLGTALLPVVSSVSKKLGELAGYVERNSGKARALAAVVLGLAAAVLLTSAAFKVIQATQRVYAAGVAVVTAVQKLCTGAALGTRLQLIALSIQQRIAAASAVVMAGATRLVNAAMRANPLGIVITLLILLVGAFILAYRKSDRFRAIVQGAFKLVRAAGAAVVAFFRKAFPPVFAILSAPFRLYLGLAKLVFRSVIAAGALVIGWVRRAFPAVRTVLSAPFQAAGRIVGAVWGNIREGAASVVESVKAIPGKIREAGARFAEAGKALIGRFIAGLGNAGAAVGDVARAIANGVESVINGAIDKLNALLEFSIKVGPKTFSINPPNIPHVALAGGGIVTGPTFALIGENGPEAVIPLGRGGTLGTTYVYHVTINGAIDPEGTARAVRRVLRDSERRNGRAA